MVMRSASRSTLRILMFFGALVLAAVTAYAAPPPTRSDNVADTLHGTVVIDPYRWLEKQDAPETRAWIDAQNAYTKTMLDPIPGRDLIHARLEELLKTDTQSVPFEHGGRYFFSRRLANQELSILYMRRGAGGKDEVLLDPHPMSADHTTSVGFIDVTDDGKLMAYSTRLGGKDEVKVSFMDLDTRKDLPDVLPEARYFGVSIKNDKSGFFYSKYTGQGSRIYYHAMGSDPAKDVYLFGDGYGPGIIASQGLSEDGRWLLIVVSFGSATDKSEVYVKDVAADGPIVPIVKDVDAYFAPDIAGDYMYLKTNWDASNWRVFKVSLKDPAREHCAVADKFGITWMVIVQPKA
jgi:prolyl oligopeptidase